MHKLLRRGRPLAVLSVVFLTILACLYYSSYTNNVVTPTPRGSQLPKASEQLLAAPTSSPLNAPLFCPDIRPASADVDTVTQFTKFEFQPSWMKSKEYWDAHFEERYQKRKAKWDQLPLKVILVPHSHNDPGWLKTYDSYFHYHTKNILNNMADKLKIFSNMTFIWSEISYFSQWWESAHPTKRNTIRKLLADNRLEITTGGWVMTDEATSHIYAMLDQLIEGHQWVKNNLGILPKTGWSIDPFGHGSTVPYLLKASGVDTGTVIQRIHYAWKQWLAEKEMGDFMWRQNWDADGHTDMLTHNQPFDIYSIKHSCGPHPQVCLNFDFRKVAGEYTEYSMKSVPIDDNNVQAKAELLLNQYGRTGSLFPHNVVLMPLGDDFRYEHDIEWEQQYLNYKRLFDYINQHRDRHNAELVFGTPQDYFKEVRKRMETFKSLQGDFFVYSDIFAEGRPAYWSGYYTTRPYWKILDRELESNLRSAEILFTWALNRARQIGSNSTVKLLERDYEKLTKARRHLGLFQHHDAITGTSRSFVMHDYALKIFESLQDAAQIQGFSAQTLLRQDNLQEKEQDPRYLNNLPTSSWLISDGERESYERLPQKVPITVTPDQPRHIVVFNSLSQPRRDVLSVHVTSPNVQVLDANGAKLPIQVNPVWNLTSTLDKPSEKERSLENELRMVPDVYQLMFYVDIPALTLATFTLRSYSGRPESRAVVYCADCGSPSNPFEIKKIQPGDVQLENHRMKLLIDGRTGFLKAITKKSTGTVTQCAFQFSAYPSAQFHSGAYLFMPDPHSRDPEHEVLDEDSQQIVITSGPLVSQLDVVYNKMLHHFVRIYHAAGVMADAVYIENVVDFEAPPKNRETELFMRVVSDISNGDPPEFYTDLNGFQMQRRVKVERIGIEGNYFPVTTQAFIQDTRRRLSLLVDHAQGASAWQPGHLEVMLDRRTLYDDSRGMGEGVVDNKKTLMRYWLLLEELSSNNMDQEPDALQRPSLFAHLLSNSLNYPANVFVSENPVPPTQLSLFTKPIPCDTHIINLRTLSDLVQFPSRNVLFISQRLGFSCAFEPTLRDCPKVGPTTGTLLQPQTSFTDLQVSGIEHVTLTGLKSIKRVESLDQVELEPMGLITLNLTFSS